MTETDIDLIDSHVHLFHQDYEPDRAEVIERARNAGVRRFVVPGTDVASSERALELARKFEGIFVGVGIHPHDAAKAAPSDFERIRAMSGEAGVRAIGEIGLDYHYDFSPRDAQREVFDEQLTMAADLGLPVIIHTRESMRDALESVRSVVHKHPGWCSDAVGARRGVFHCFSGTPEEAAEIFNLGFYVSFPGILTFKNSPVLPTFRKLPLDRVLVETDGPHMAPVPFRGKRNEPAYVVHVARTMSDATVHDLGHIAKVTRANTQRLFRIP